MTLTQRVDKIAKSPDELTVLSGLGVGIGTPHDTAACSPTGSFNRMCKNRLLRTPPEKLLRVRKTDSATERDTI
jgi:hypothetical protein